MRNIISLIRQVRSLLEQLQDVCNELKDENEIAIIKKYGSKAKCYTIAIIRKTMVVESFICFKLDKI